MNKKFIIILIVILGIAVSGAAIFFAQKYWSLYSDYKTFLGSQEVSYELAERAGEEVQRKDWTFGKYLQFLEEGKEKGKELMAEYEAAIEAVYQDTVGGKTPEKTWESYINAIYAGDLELASKHWIPRERDSILEELQQLQQEDGLIEFIQRFPSSDSWESSNSGDYWNGVDRASYHYDFQGEDFPIKFEFNPYSKVWKIKWY